MAVWYIFKVEDSLESTIIGPGARRLFAVSPSNELTPECRTVDEVVGAASDKGFDVSYANTFYGISPERLEQVRRRIHDRLRREFRSFPRHAVSVEPVLRLVK
jgi:hypothetical protein